MNKFDLDSVHVVLFEDKVHIRRVIKYALQEIGFRQIHECGLVDELRPIIRTQNPDLLLFDMDADMASVCEIMHDIRHQRFGVDPFVVAIGTTWYAEPAIVRTALDSGVDDIVIKPISVQIMTQRVHNMIENRREFIATDEYIGPERRNDSIRAGDEDEPPHIQVPNSLRHKATGDLGAVVDEAAVQRAMEAIVLQKIQRLAIDLTAVAMELETMVVAGGDAFEFGDKVNSAARLAAEVRDYVTSQDIKGMREIAESMATVVDLIRKTTKPKRHQFEILRLHSQAVTSALLNKHAEAGFLAQELQKVVTITASRAETGASTVAATG